MWKSGQTAAKSCNLSGIELQCLRNPVCWVLISRWSSVGQWPDLCWEIWRCSTAWTLYTSWWGYFQIPSLRCNDHFEPCLTLFISYLRTGLPFKMSGFSIGRHMDGTFDIDFRLWLCTWKLQGRQLQLVRLWTSPNLLIPSTDASIPDVLHQPIVNSTTYGTSARQP